jgi:hypothetical protein
VAPAGQRHVDGPRDLLGEPVEVQRGHQAQHRPRHARRDGHEVRLGEGLVGEAEDAARDLDQGTGVPLGVQLTRVHVGGEDLARARGAPEVGDHAEHVGGGAEVFLLHLSTSVVTSIRPRQPTASAAPSSPPPRLPERPRPGHPTLDQLGPAPPPLLPGLTPLPLPAQHLPRIPRPQHPDSPCRTARGPALDPNQAGHVSHPRGHPPTRRITVCREHPANSARRFHVHPSARSRHSSSVVESGIDLGFFADPEFTGIWILVAVD